LEALQRVDLRVGLKERVTTEEAKGVLQPLSAKLAWTPSVRDEEKLARTKQWVRTGTVSDVPHHRGQGQGDAQRPKKVVTFDLHANQVHYVEKYIETPAGDTSPQPRRKNAHSQ
jgi:hypothetical protein